MRLSMKFKMMSIAAALFLSLSAGFSADTGADTGINGRWTGKYGSGQGGPMDMDYTFKAYGSFLTGTTIGGANGERIPVLNGRINGRKISFTVVLNRITVVPSQFQVMVQQMKFDYTGDISGDKLKLKFVINGEKNSGGSFTVKREQETSLPTPQNFDYEGERRRAFAFLKEQNLLGARPILEQLFEVKPDDAEVLEMLAFSTLATVTVEKDTAKHPIIHLQARAMAERAKELGQNSSLLKTLIEQICDDGTLKAANAAQAAAKTSPAVEALTEGEAAFNSGKMEQAIAHYERAAQLAPGLYEAPLFIGDAYYSLNEKEKAYEYYARAVAVNPERETAYRYWGNVLMSENRLDEAKEKFIESVILEPYSRLTWQFLSNWAGRSKIQIGHPRIDVPENMVQKSDDNKLRILVPSNLDSASKDGSSAWMSYGISRATWKINNEKFSEAFPNEKEYRHSLTEEYRALSAVVENVMMQLEEGRVRESDLGESIANLLKLHNDGLLEAYILLAKPDEGIARDYAEYRKHNSVKLRRYINEYVIEKK